MRKTKLVLFALLFAVAVSSARASDIPDGAIIKTAGNPDVYIVKHSNGKFFKRLVLNPQVFKSYSHLRWEDLIIVDQSVMDSFTASELVRVDGQDSIYQLAPDGDSGNKTLITDMNGLDLDSIYTINGTDFNNYVKAPTAEFSGLLDVYKVIDGDTVSVTIEGVNRTVRLIGVDSPEVTGPYTAAQCYGNESSAMVKERLTGKKVRLASDTASGDTDKYNRLLRYVYLEDGTLFNQWLIEEGYAKEYTYNDVAYGFQKSFKTAEAAAKTAKKGLWGVEVCALSENFFAQSDYVCTANTYNCSDFKTQAQAEAAYAFCMNATGADVHLLDSDEDGMVCESLN